MKLKFYLLLSLFLISFLASGQDYIDFQDRYQEVSTRLVKSAALKNGKVSYEGTGTDVFGAFNHYRIYWCPTYNHVNYPNGAWVITRDEWSEGGCTVEPDHINPSATGAPPAIGMADWWDTSGGGIHQTTVDGPLKLSGPGLEGPPTVTTNSASNVAASSVTLGGEVTVWGGKTVTERGVVYATVTSPTTSHSKDANGSGLGTFSESVTGLQTGTTYYVRAYAINGNSTGYGPEKTFTTLTPTITASGTSSISTTTFGTASANGSFTVSGVNMVAGILVTPPAGFEVSTNSGSGFGATTTVGAAGTIGNTTVYVRLAAATAAGSYSGNINLTSTGAATKTSAVASSTVDKRSITITATDVPKTYGAVLSSGTGSTAFSITAGSLQNSNTIASVTITYGTGAAAGTAVGSYNTAVPSAPVGGNGFTANNYNITYTNGNVVVGQRALTVSATAANKSYGAVLTDGSGSTAFTQSGLQNSETIGSVTVAYATGAGNGNTSADAIGTYTNKVTISAATGGNFTASNYSISYTQGNIIVGTRALTVTANSANKIYGTTLTGGAGSTAFTSSGLQNSETIGSVTIAYAAGAGNGNTANDAVNTYTNKVTASSATGGTFTASNYSINYVDGNIVVTPATLTYTANASSRDYGSANEAFTGSLSGFLNGDTEATATTGTLSFSSAATDASNVGSYLITGNGLTANNYTFLQAAGNSTALTITPATLTYLADAASRDYGLANPTFSGTVTGFVLGQTQAGATTGTLLFSSPATTASAVGSYAIDGSGLTANNGNYSFVQGAANATALTITCVSGTLFVKQGGTGPGTSWLTASGDLQQMINQACSGAEIWVAGGTYRPNRRADATSTITANDRSNAFVLKSDVKIYGGFAGTELALADRNLTLTANASTLSGDLDENDNGFTGNELNAGHVVISAGGIGTAVLDGFTISGGNNIGASDVTVNGQVINYFGGGISCKVSSPILTNLIVTGNEGLYGAGIGIYTSSPTVSNAHIYNNKALYGGAIGNSNSSPTLTNILINGNSASVNAGALFSEFGSVPLLTHVTIAANITDAAGAGNIFNNGGTLKIRNSIIYGNDKDFSSEGAPALDIKNSLVQGNADLTNGNINGNTNPDFVLLSAAGLGSGGDYHLSLCSPVINAGMNSYATGIDIDLDKNNRFQGSSVDMGAYEFASNPNGPDELADHNEVATLNIESGQSNNFTVDNAACRIVASVIPDNSGTSVAGSVVAKVWIASTQPTQYVKRHYEITPSTNASTATGKVTLYATDAEFSAFNTQIPSPAGLLPLSTDNITDMTAGIANIRIEKRSGESSDGTGLPGTYSGTITTLDPVDQDIVWNAGASRWEITFDVTGFSGFFIKTQSAPLPVRWVSVGAALNTEKQAVITWKVEEASVASYSIEKSANGRSFGTIAQLDGKGDGTHQYSITDNDILIGTAYYRIMQTDLDGKFTFSRIVSVGNNGNIERLVVYPLPAQNELIIEAKNQTDPEYSISLTDMNGRILGTYRLRAGINKINISELNPGIYLLRTNRAEVFKVLKK